jgi:GTP-binding protein HflX
VGYTNAGKSTLFNALTGAEVLEEDKLFATLDPTTRRLRLPTNQNVLLSDTVGFIRKLPHRLVDAFKATLEEVVNADLLVHVVDVSHDQAESQYLAVQGVLAELGTDQKPMLTVLNKTDLCQARPALVQGWLDRIPGSVAISARNGEGFPALWAELGSRLRPVRDLIDLAIPQAEAALVARLHAVGQVVERRYDGRMARFKAMIPPSVRFEFERYIVGAN